MSETLILTSQLKEHRDFWTAQLARLSGPSNLPLDFKRSRIYSPKPLTVELNPGTAACERLANLTSNSSFLSYTALLAVLNICLHKYTRNTTIVVGSPAYRGDENELHQINALPIINEVDGDVSFREFLLNTRETLAAAYSRQDFPVQNLIAEAAEENRCPLFDIALVFEPIHWPLAEVKHDITITLTREGAALRGRVDFSGRLFRRETVERFAGHYLQLLETTLADTSTPLRNLTLVSGAEREQILSDWNDTAGDYAAGACLPQLFEEQVARTPHAIALCFDGKQLTYEELNHQANQLANYLLQLGVGPDSLVALCLERSTDLLVGLVGALKCGAGIVPLDPSYPSERLGMMMHDAQVAAVLTQQSLVSRLPAHSAPVIHLDADRKEISAMPETTPQHRLDSDNLLYVLYTSGSTGVPKGVAMNHRPLVNLITWQLQNFRSATPARTLQYTSLSFDVSFQEIFSTLCSGGTLVLASEETRRDPLALGQYLVAEKIERLFLPFVALHQLAETCVIQSLIPATLHEVITAGEQLQSTPSIIEFFRRLPDCTLANHYGPTEAHVVTTHTLQGPPSRWPTLPSIGRPIANARIYLLDPMLEPAPIGVAGDLFIGGVPVARGYLNRPELTAAKFLPDPYATEPGQRMYKTGDLARYLSDGNIEFLGRADNQLKLRGFRVELGEIEAVLRLHPAVQEGAAVIREDAPGEKRLVAYLVTKPGQTASTNDLRRFLSEKLPAYMIPATFMTLDALPLTPTGKVDRLALPARDVSRPELEREYVAPRNRIEEMLAGIWAEVLGLENVGVKDNFFELGGDSILTVQIVAKANRAGLRLVPNQLFQHQTVAGLASVCGTAPVARAEQGTVTGPAPLTPIQHWFFEQQLPESNHFNMAYLFEPNEPLDPVLLEQSVKALLLHHDALRLRFAKDGEGWRQWISAPEEQTPFSGDDFSQLDEATQQAALAEKAESLQRSLDLEHGPLLRVAYFNLGPRGGRLLMLIHHLAVDGVSWRILLEDLQRAYQQLREGKAVELGLKTTSWRQWAERLLDHAQHDEVTRELDYWIENAGSNLSFLPVDFPGGKNVEALAKVLPVSLSVPETNALLREVPGAYHMQINDVLLTALVQAFSSLTHSPSLLLDLEGHGREQIADDLDLSRTVGWFTTISPVLLNVANETSPENALQTISRQLREQPRHGIGYGLLRYLSKDSAVQQRLSSLPSAEVSFNYIGQVDQDLTASSLLKVTRDFPGPIAGSTTPLPHKIYVNAIVFQHQLLIRFKYSEGLYQASTVQVLADAFLASLRRIISHTHSARRQLSRPADFPLLKLDADALDKALRQVSFAGTKDASSHEVVEDAYPLSPAQEGILFHSLYEHESGVYVVQMSCTFRGLNVPAVERAWQRVVQRHPILRSAFVWGDLDRPLQVTGRQVELQFEKQDWRGTTVVVQEERFQSYLAADRSRGFEPSAAPLMRFAFLRTKDDEYYFVWSHHHLLLDGWSIFMVLKEVFEYYEAFSQGLELDLPQKATYRDYLAWLQQHEHELSEAKAFWQRVLRGFTAPTALEMKGAPAGATGYDEVIDELPETLTAELQSLASQNKLTLNTLVQGTWALLLSHYGKTNDVLFGATASGRNAPLKGIEEMIGMFINVLPARVVISPEASLLPWLHELQQQQFEMRNYEFSPLTQVQRWSEVPRGVRLFQSILSFENYPVDDSVRQYTKSLEISNARSSSQTNYPLTVIVAPLAKLKIRIVYDRSRFNADFIRQMQEHFSSLLRGFVAQPETRLSSLAQILVRNEKSRVVVQQAETERLSSMRLKRVTPKSVSLAQDELVTMRTDGPGNQPLILTPAYPDLDLADWAQNQRELIEAKLFEYGALLFRGFTVETPTQFEQLAQAVCTDLFGEYGDLPREGVSGKVYGSTPYPADKTILFHNESSHLQRWPLKIFFYCLTPAQQGGETPFVDCRRAYQLLDEDLRKRLVQKQLMYVRNYIDGLDVSWQSFFHTTDKAVVEELCRQAAMSCEWRNGAGLQTRQVRPAVALHPKTGEHVLFNQIQLHHVSCLEPELRSSLLAMYGEENLPRSVYYGDGSPIEDSVIAELSEVYRQTATSFAWRRGDILLLDNMLTAHGRNPYRGERKIVVAMGEMIGNGSRAVSR